jgi:hypothetical protein
MLAIGDCRFAAKAPSFPALRRAVKFILESERYHQGALIALFEVGVSRRDIFSESFDPL